VKRHVLDADSLRAFLEDRPGAATIEELLWKAVQSQQRVYVSVLSWNYLFSTVWRFKGESVAREKMKQLEQLPIEVVDVTEAEAAGAAKLSATYGLDYLDCIAAATAQQRRATLVTTNKALSKLGDTVKIFFAD
jgi:predicted nucleic acid-binding protein